MLLYRQIKFLTIAGICLLIQVGQPKFARADSPLTSTNLASAYQDLPIVLLAQQEKRLQGEILTFLLGDAPIDQKAAVINALGTKFEGHNNGYSSKAGHQIRRYQS